MKVEEDARLTGTRIHVRAGEKVCAGHRDSTPRTLRWVGFRPHDG